MKETHEQFTRRLLDELLQSARAWAYPAVKDASWQLAEALTYYVETDTSGRLYIPHYWALYVHDGRGPFGAPSPHYSGRPATYLVWFRDPRNDPRLNQGRYPKRASEVRRLTYNEFHYWLGVNRQVRAQYPPGTDKIPVPMIVTKYVSDTVNGKRFFGNKGGEGMHGFRLTAAKIVKRMFEQHVRDYMGPLFKIQHKGTTITIL